MQQLNEIASVLALKGADCGCGKPAFMHSRCYALASVSDTAFHIVVLRQYTKLESLMISEEGKGIDTVCPYLKVSKNDLLYARRNALEWACALRLEDSVVRLVVAAEAQGKNNRTYLPTATAVCAMHTVSGKEALLKSLLNDLDNIVQDPRMHHDNVKLQYYKRLLGRRSWILKIFTSLEQHRRLDGMSVLRKNYPYCESESMLRIWPKQLQWEPIKAFMEFERTCCDFQQWNENENYKHWAGCRKDWCRNRYSKAGPWQNACMSHFWMQMTFGNNWKCEERRPPHDTL